MGKETGKVVEREHVEGAPSLQVPCHNRCMDAGKDEGRKEGMKVHTPNYHSSAISFLNLPTDVITHVVIIGTLSRVGAGRPGMAEDPSLL